ncbi:MAG: hypothetical protein ACR2NW_03515 [Thermodesulfobacteriota bacterium]
MSNYTGIAEILNNTEYSVLHGWQNLPDKLDSDLDIVINPTHLNLLERSLLEGKEGKVVQLLQHESSCFYFVLAHKNGSGLEFLKVDAATDYRRDGFTFFTADQFIRRRYKWNSFWVTSPNSEFPYLLVKKILKGNTPEHQKNRFYELVTELGIKKSKRLAANLFGKKLGYRIVSWIYADEWERIESQLPTLRRALIWHELKKNPINPLKYWLMELKRIYLRWNYPTGLFVVVLGPDGSGKTTLIESLKTQLLGAFRTADTFHLRPNILGRKKNDNPVTDPHGKPTRSYLISIIKAIYYVSDYILGYLLKIHTKLVRSTLVIFDRYFDDIIVDPKRYRYGGSSWLINFCNYFVPRPDLYLVLDVKENELMSRKQEVSMEELGRQRTAYRNLASKLKNAHIIDGSTDEKQVLNDASEIVMNYLHNRYIERRRIWFKEDPYSSLDWLNTILSPDNKKTMFNISESKMSNKSSEWGTYKKFKFLLLRDGRGYLLPYKRNLYSSALELYNVQSKKAKLFKRLSKLTSGFGFTKTVRLMISRDQKYAKLNKLHFFEYIKKELKRDDIEFSISLGTPGQDRKPVIQLLSHTGEVIGFVKLGTELTNNLIQNEVNTVARLSQISSEFFCVPEMLDKGWWHNHYYAIQSKPYAKLLSPPMELEPCHIGVLKELADLNTTWITLDKSIFWEELNENVVSIEDNLHLYKIIIKVLNKIENKLNELPLPFHMSHGDFAPWNTYLIGEKLFVFDWEYSEKQALPGNDLFHFVLQTNYLLKNAGPIETYNSILNGIENGLENSYWKKLGFGKDEALSLFILYVLQRIFSLITKEENNFEELSYFSKIITHYLYTDGEHS